MNAIRRQQPVQPEAIPAGFEAAGYIYSLAQPCRSPQTLGGDQRQQPSRIATFKVVQP